MTEDLFFDILSVIVIVILLWLCLFFWVLLPAKMARKRGRSALGWVLLCWMLSPLTVIILLLIVGDSKEKLTRDILERTKNR